MKILHIISSLNPIYGGPAEGVRQLAIAAINKGYDVEIVAADPPGSPWIIDSKVKVHYLGPSFFRYAFVPRLVPWLRKHAAEYDLVILQGIWQYLGYASWKVLLKMDIPYFVFTHGQLGTWFKKSPKVKNFKKNIYWKLVQYRILRDAKAVFFTSEDEKLQSRESFKPYELNEIVVGYGTQIPEGDPERQRELFHSRFPGLRDKRLFVFVGRLAQQKACDLLLQAFAEVSRGDSNLHLVMAGPDEDGWQDELVRLSEQIGIASQITWTGMLTGELKWGAFRVAECFVLPSHHESFGVVVAEALACGIPVLISDKVNIWHEVNASGAGFVSNDDLPGTVEIIKRWIALSCQEKDIMRVNARRCFYDNFDINNSIKKMTSAIDQLIRGCNQKKDECKETYVKS